MLLFSGNKLTQPNIKTKYGYNQPIKAIKIKTIKDNLRNNLNK